MDRRIKTATAKPNTVSTATTPRANRHEEDRPRRGSIGGFCRRVFPISKDDHDLDLADLARCDTAGSSASVGITNAPMSG